jgi:Tfp pilus assembly protein PilO
MANGDPSERKLMIITLSVAAAAIAILGGVIYYLHYQGQELDKKYNKLETRHEGLQGEIAMLSPVKKQHKALLERQGKYNHLTVTKNEEPQVVAKISEMIRRAGLSVERSIRTQVPKARGKKKKGPPFAPITYRYEARGSFEQILKFSRLVEQLEANEKRPLLVMRNLSIQSQGEGYEPAVEGAEGHTTRFEITFYVKKNAAPAAK